MSTRKPLIAANWKMYKTPSQSSEFVTAFLPLVHNHTRDEIVLCPPFVDIAAVVAGTHGSKIHVGGQNMTWHEEGAFTGEISAPMLVACGCTQSSSATPNVASILARPMKPSTKSFTPRSNTNSPRCALANCSPSAKLARPKKFFCGKLPKHFMASHTMPHLPS